MEVLENTRTGSYTIGALISQDETCTLYLAEDNSQEYVLLEIYNVSDPETAVSRLKTIQSTPELSLLDAGLTSDKQPYAISSHQPGNLLSQLLQKKPDAFSPAETASLAEQIATQLHAAQQQQINHAGIRPEKIWITKHQTPVILGWGEYKPGESSSVNNTADFVAPEYRQDEKPTTQASIYALGILIYTLLAAHPPRYNTKEWDIFGNAASAQLIPLEEANPDLTADFYQLVRNCLWRQPWNRFEDFLELKAALPVVIPPVQKETAVPAVTIRGAGTKKMLAPPFLYGLIGIAAFGLIAALYFIFQGGDSGSIDQNNAVPPTIPAVIDLQPTQTEPGFSTRTAVPTPLPTLTAVPAATQTKEPTSTAAAAPPTETAAESATAVPTALPTETETAVPTATETASCIPAPPPGWVPYTIQPNDFLFNLAIATGTTVERIQEVNCLADATLSVGQSIFLPTLPATETPIPPTAEPTSSSGGGGGGGSSPNPTSPSSRSTPTPPPPP